MNPFIVLEALDAGGSQTQTDLLTKRLTKLLFKVMQLHFPQEDRATGRLIYDKFLLMKNKYPFSRRERALLYIQDFFSKAEDIQNALQKKVIVVSDRYCTSTMAYQTAGLAGAARRRMLAWITWLCYQGKPALPKPDMILYIDTPVAVCLKRLKGKRIDFHETRQKLTTFRNNYLKLAKEQKWIVINGGDKKGNQRTREDIHEEIWGKLRSVLK